MVLPAFVTNNTFGEVLSISSAIIFTQKHFVQTFQFGFLSKLQSTRNKRYIKFELLSY